MASRRRTERDGEARAGRRRCIALTVGFTIVAVATLAYVLWPEPEVDLGSWLAERDLELNVGFAGHYLPGTVVQTHKPGVDGSPRRLVRPEIVLWPERCFPGKTPKETAYPLPRRVGRRQSAARLGGEEVSGLLPSLSVDGAKSWDVEVFNPRLQTFAKAELARHFSEACLDALEPIFDAGTDPAWMATILEAVVADGLRVTVEWRSGVAAEARVDAVEGAKAGMAPAKASIDTKVDDEDRTVIEADGMIVVAYRAAEMAAVE